MCTKKREGKQTIKLEKRTKTKQNVILLLNFSTQFCLVHCWFTLWKILFCHLSSSSFSPPPVLLMLLPNTCHMCIYLHSTVKRQNKTLCILQALHVCIWFPLFLHRFFFSFLHQELSVGIVSITCSSVYVSVVYLFYCHLLCVILFSSVKNK